MTAAGPEALVTLSFPELPLLSIVFGTGFLSAFWLKGAGS